MICGGCLTQYASWRHGVIPSALTVRRVLTARGDWFGRLRLLAAIVLVAAGTIKMLRPHSGSADAAAVLYADKELSRVLGACEVIFGLWVVLTRRRVIAWGALAICFGGFCTYAVLEALRNSPSCGCLGPLRVPPIYAACLDSALLTCLLVWAPCRVRSPGLQRACVVSSLVFTACAVEAARSASHGQDASRVSAGARLKVLEPDKWIGLRFPLIEHIDIGMSLESREWTVLIYRYDCEGCRREIETLRNGVEGIKSTRRLALVAMPPYPARADEEKPRAYIVHGRLANPSGGRWVLATPCRLDIVDGVVRGCFSASAGAVRSNDTARRGAYLHRFSESSRMTELTISKGDQYEYFPAD